MIKLLVGLIKGAVVGGAVGYGALVLGNATGFSNGWLTFGIVGMLVGLLVGRPLWSLIRDKTATTWVGALKAVFGFGVGCGLYAIVAKAWNPTFDIATVPAQWPPLLGGVIGAVYGAFVEIDDGIGDGDRAHKGRGAATHNAAAKDRG